MGGLLLKLVQQNTARGVKWAVWSVQKDSTGCEAGGLETIAICLHALHTPSGGCPRQSVGMHVAQCVVMGDLHGAQDSLACSWSLQH